MVEVERLGERITRRIAWIILTILVAPALIAIPVSLTREKYLSLPCVNGGAIPGHWGGVKPGQSGSTEAAREARVSIAL